MAPVKSGSFTDFPQKIPHEACCQHSIIARDMRHKYLTLRPYLTFLRCFATVATQASQFDQLAHHLKDGTRT